MAYSDHDDARQAPSHPRGPNQVRVAVFRAAITLFGEKGPDAVSVRDIASLANVNHGLIHRYFGSKDQLLQAVIARYASDCRQVINQSASALQAVGNIFDLVQEQPSIARIFAHLLLTGHPANEIALKDAGSSRLAVALEQAGLQTTPTDARLMGALCVVVAFGWSLFEDFILYAVDHREDATNARSAIKQLMALLVQLRLEDGGSYLVVPSKPPA